MLCEGDLGRDAISNNGRILEKIQQPFQIMLVLHTTLKHQ